MEVVPTNILLIGEAAGRLTPLIPPDAPLAMSNSILEAILAPAESPELILIDTRRELDQLQAGIRSLRRTNPDARIVLLCEPEHEAICRRALAWGADDYEILPLEQRHTRALLEGFEPAARGMSSANLPLLRELAASDSLEGNAAALHVPMAVQRALLEEVFEGKNPAEFAGRAVAALGKCMRPRGTLSFIPDGGDGVATATKAVAAVAGELRQRVHFTGQMPFGVLVWQADALAPSDAAMLEHAGGWLASLLAVARKIEQFRLMAITDELSGAYNLRYFKAKLAMDIKEAEENHSVFTLLYFDIDNFKKYNDTFGHAAGDAIIRELIRILNTCTRPYDLVARLGGDEFAVVYRANEAPRQPNSTHPTDVVAATERFREAVRNHKWPEACKIKGTISISGGLATYPWHARSVEELLAKADEALLAAKAKGKNVIVLTDGPGARAEV